MKKQLITIATILSFTASTAFAAGPSENLSEAGKHSAMSAKHSATGSGQIVSAAVAVPLLAVGSVGAVSTSAGEALLNNARGDTPVALEITEINITIESPEAAMNPASKEQ